ncbi:MAG: hypothetical protein ACPHAR_05550, partial [Flavobacteriaceae bacterium]
YFLRVVKECLNLFELKLFTYFRVMASKIKLSNYQRYIRFLQQEYRLSFSDYQELHTWSVTQQAAFWESISRFFTISFDKPYLSVMKPLGLRGQRLVMQSIFFLNFQMIDQPLFIKAKPIH